MATTKGAFYTDLALNIFCFLNIVSAVLCLIVIILYFWIVETYQFWTGLPDRLGGRGRCFEDVDLKGFVIGAYVGGAIICGAFIGSSLWNIIPISLVLVGIPLCIVLKEFDTAIRLEQHIDS